jgi:hypothetical protein
MIRWGYTPGAERPALDAMVAEGYARGLVYPLESDPRWAEYDWGRDPVAWLRTTQAVRRVILERFGAGQLRPGEPVATLQERFSLAYLYHRFGIQAAQQYVGGQYDQRRRRRRPDALPGSTRLQRGRSTLLRPCPPKTSTFRRSRARAGRGALRHGATCERFRCRRQLLAASAARALASLIVDPPDPPRAARPTLAPEGGLKLAEALSGWRAPLGRGAANRRRAEPARGAAVVARWAAAEQTETAASEVRAAVSRGALRRARGGPDRRRGRALRPGAARSRRVPRPPRARRL